MENFFELLKEALKGIVRAIRAHLFQKTFLNKEKTPNAIKSRVVLKRNNYLTTTAFTAVAARGRIAVLLLYYLYPF